MEDERVDPPHLSASYFATAGQLSAISAESNYAPRFLLQTPNHLAHQHEAGEKHKLGWLDERVAFGERLAFSPGAEWWMRGEGEGGREEREEGFEVRVEEGCRGLMRESASRCEATRSEGRKS